MRILHIISSADRSLGGPIEAVNQLTQVFKILGHNTSVVTVDSPNAPFLKGQPLTVYPLGPAVGNYGYSRRLLPWLRRHAQEYDHIIIHGLWQYHSFAAHQALRQVGKPYFLYTHGMLAPWFKRTYPLKHLKKSLYWPWGEFPVLRDAEAVCFTCEEERVLARQSFAPYQCHEVVVNLGTSAPAGDREAQREVFFSHYPHLRDKRLLLFLGRIHRIKGCDLLIAAFAEVVGKDQAWRLVMAGPDQVDWQSKLQEQAERLGIADRVTWTGMLSGDAKWGAFYAAEAFILPSHQENFGIAVAEAMACGLPVLLSNKVNIGREIENDGAGIVADDTVEGTTKMLRDWLALPSAEKQVMRQRAKTCFLTRFEIRNAAQNLLDVLSASGSPDNSQTDKDREPKSR